MAHAGGLPFRLVDDATAAIGAADSPKTQRASPVHTACMIEAIAGDSVGAVDIPVRIAGF